MPAGLPARGPGGHIQVTRGRQGTKPLHPQWHFLDRD